MDGNRFNSAYLPYNAQHQPQHHQQQQNLSSFGNLSAHVHQPDTSSTLPPIQNPNGGYSQFGSLAFAQQPGSQTNTPTTPRTPASSSVTGTSASAFSFPPGNMGPPSFQPPYPPPQSMMFPSSSSSTLPPTTSTAGLPTIRPMPPGGLSAPMGTLPSLASTAGLGQQPAFTQNEEPPTHVVGSQGRRGTLPSAPGRPEPPPPGSSQSTKSMIPQKDSDGKFPCPHCNKTYLHAKHLKRHLLRHTGDRPYQCHLCHDTFSRSDILKRHFQKCSIRRGNPTGANHLAHQRRNHSNAGRGSISQQDGPMGLAGVAEVQHNMSNTSPSASGDVSTRTSRANSLITPANMSHRSSLATGLGILTSNAPHNNQSMTSANYDPGLPAFIQNGSNFNFNNGPHINGNVFSNAAQPMSFLGQQSSRFDNSDNSNPLQHASTGDGSGAAIDWSRMFNQGGQDSFIGSQPANASSNGLTQIKAEPDSKPNFDFQHDPSNESFLGSLYSHPGAFGSEYGDQTSGIPGFPNWSTDDPLQTKVDSLIQFCFPGGSAGTDGDQAAEIVKACLTVDNVKHFAEHYTSYHGHWPTLHIPTFKLTDAHNSLVLAMICIGAVYSPKLQVGEVRQMMEFVRDTVIRQSLVYQRTANNQLDGLGTRPWDTDEMQALLLIQSLFIWHGATHQREVARAEFPMLVRIAKAMNLFQHVGPGHYAYSTLHHQRHHLKNGQVSQVDAADFNWWQGWLEQEKRNRTLYLLFLTEAAMVIYFNSNAQIDPLEIRLTLPADDAAWDARDEQECADALGLNGPAAQMKNVSGTRKATQPGMRDALRTLLEPSPTFHNSATNAYSKFVLVHALIIRIIACQKVLLVPDGGSQGSGFGFGGSGPATPLSQHDWLDQHGGGSLSAGNSGHATPTDSLGPNPANIQAQMEKKRLLHALEKFKHAYDVDMELQYPPSQSGLRRFGFSRDCVHFFFLGRSFLQSQRAADWTAPADVRFKQVMSLLKRIKNYVVGDNESKGLDIGSVGDIDEQYGLDNLTLDMKLLFKPYNSQLDSPIAGVHTGSN